MYKIIIYLFLIQILIISCSKPEKKYPDNLNNKILSDFNDKKIHKLQPEEINRFLSLLNKSEKSFYKRLKISAEKQIGQPHIEGAAGEFPVEAPSDKLLYNLEESDCVTFIENTIAMSLADTWRSYFVTLQRIRYKNGLIGWETRNHFFEADWEKNNSWLLTDINHLLSKDKLLYHELTVDRSLFYSINDREKEFPEEKVKFSYFQNSSIPEILNNLVKLNETNGHNPVFIFNMIRTNHTGKKWVGHLGFAVVENDQVYMIHSRIPEVKKEPFIYYLNDQLSKNPKRIKDKRPYVEGFRFFMLNNHPLSELKKIDGNDAPLLIIKSR